MVQYASWLTPGQEPARSLRTETRSAGADRARLRRGRRACIDRPDGPGPAVGLWDSGDAWSGERPPRAAHHSRRRTKSGKPQVEVGVWSRSLVHALVARPWRPICPNLADRSPRESGQSRRRLTPRSTADPRRNLVQSWSTRLTSRQEVQPLQDRKHKPQLRRLSWGLLRVCAARNSNPEPAD